MEKIHPGSATLLFKRADGFRIIEQLIVMRQPNLSQLAVPVHCKFVLDGKRLKGGGGGAGQSCLSSAFR